MGLSSAIALGDLPEEVEIHVELDQGASGISCISREGRDTGSRNRRRGVSWFVAPGAVFYGFLWSIRRIR